MAEQHRVGRFHIPPASMIKSSISPFSSTLDTTLPKLNDDGVFLHPNHQCAVGLGNGGSAASIWKQREMVKICEFG